MKIGRKEKKEKNDRQAYFENGAINYEVYIMTGTEKIMYMIVAAIGLALLGYIFYRSAILSLALALLAVKYPKYREKQIIKSRKRKLNMQFKDMLYSLSSIVSAGNSVERGFSLVMDDMLNQYADSDAYIIKELRLINSKLALNQNIEDILIDLGQRSGLEDIITFANIFEISKRTGGNLVDIIRQTTETIADKIEIEMEIDTLLSGKKMEQKVLTAMPIFLVLILTETTGGFMAPIFTTISGRVVATIALIMVGIGFFWSQKITDIQI